ncbi:serine hydrolase [Curtobacterium sp. MCBD17_013]|nr:serine hydrolase [Curtobacterium sp. MCBD17_013]
MDPGGRGPAGTDGRPQVEPRPSPRRLPADAGRVTSASSSDAAPGGAASARAPRPADRLPADVLSRIDDLFRQRVERGVAPSSAWGVFDRQGLVASGGHGDRGDGRAPDHDTAYRIASCTKSVTAAALLLLAERGLLDLDDPVTAFVPAFASVALPRPDAPVPTLRMLLTMSAGFPTDDPWADRQESLSDDAFDGVLRGGLLFDRVPGTGFAYSNLGYALLGRVVARVSGRPYQRFATEELLDPLGLTRTAFTAPDGAALASGYRSGPDGWERLPFSGPGAFSSIGGLFSTVTDLAAWARFLAAAFDGIGVGTTGAAAWSGSAPLSAADRRAMQQASRTIPGGTGLPGLRDRPAGYGFGLFVEQDPVVGTIVSHSGGYPGFSAHMRWSTADGVGVVAFENATGARVPMAATEAHDLLLSARPAPPADPVLDVTRRAQAAVTRLLADGFPDDLADAVCTPNVAMDVPYERRRAAVREALSASGADLAARPVREETRSPTHLVWWHPGSTGLLRVEIRLAPIAAGLVQTLTVRVEDAPPV